LLLRSAPTWLIISQANPFSVSANVSERNEAGTGQRLSEGSGLAQDREAYRSGLNFFKALAATGLTVTPIHISPVLHKIAVTEHPLWIPIKEQGRIQQSHNDIAAEFVGCGRSPHKNPCCVWGIRDFYNYLTSDIKSFLIDAAGFWI
jgi:hypothetical protein